MMATNDLLNELQKDNIKLDEDTQRKITNILLRNLEDDNKDVQYLAIRYLGQLVSKIKNDRFQVTAILKSCLHALDSDKLLSAVSIASITEQIIAKWSAKFEIYDWDLIISICDSLANKLPLPTPICSSSSALASFTGHSIQGNSSTNLNSSSSIGHPSQSTHPTLSNNSNTNRSSINSLSSNQGHSLIQTSTNASQYAMNLSAAATASISDLMYHNNHSQSISQSSDNMPTKNNESLKIIQASLQRLITRLQNESNQGNIFGCDDHLYDLIEKFYHLFDENVIVGLLDYRTKFVNTLDERCITNLSRLITKCSKHETRKAIRLKSIAALSKVFSTHRAIYEDELMDKIFIPNFLNADQENDLGIRQSIVYLLLDFASMCLNHKHCLEALKIIKKILVKPFKFAQSSDQSNDLVYIFENSDVIDSRLAIRGLTKIFKEKLFCLPTEPAIKILDILLDYLYQTYKHPLQAPQPAEMPLIRQELFSLLLTLRANEHGQLGLDTSEEQPIQSISEHSKQNSLESARHTVYEQNKEKYSPFLICKRLDPPTGNLGSSNSKPGSPTLVSNQYCSVLNSSYNSGAQEPATVDLTGMFTAIVDCINHETDYDVLKPVLEGLPYLLANRSLVLSTGPNIVDNVCIGLSELIRSNADKFNKQYPKNNMKSLIYKAMTALIYYRRELETKYHKTLLVTFEEGLRLSQTQCISIITMCLIEMHESLNMMRFLPQILMKLSKFSAVVNLATCQLDFLSYLILFPRLCENFAADEYICIFAIALPFTNPFKFNEYVISMAHRVIAMWFLECRPTFRKSFVEYIKKNLQSHVIQPFKENAQQAAPYSPVFAQHNTPPHPASATASPFDQSRERSLSLNAENTMRSRFEYRQSSITPALMAHSSQVPSSPPPNSPSSPSAFSFTNSDPAAGFHQTNQASSKQLNEELIETCTDLISRYTYGQCSAIPHKNPCADYLVDRDNSQTWLYGNSLVTISTSRCNASASQGGLCDNCFRSCHENATSSQSVAIGSNPCNCWCQGWAEILIRRPTGNTCWLTRLQNSGTQSQQITLADMIAPHTPAPKSHGLHPSFVQLQFFNDCGINDGMLEETTTIMNTPTNVIANNMGQNQNPNLSSTSAKPSQQSKSELILLPKDSKTDVALKVFDRIQPYETHKIGVVYVGNGQVKNRTEILANKHGSRRYMEFLRDLGTLINLSDIDTQTHFIGGLDVSGSDGQFTYFWQDSITQVVFHVATLMPMRPNDLQCNEKIRHIGNDHVCIVYNNSGEPFELVTIKGEGQCIIACIEITPVEIDTNLVTVKALPDLAQIIPTIEPRIVTNEGLSLYTRQTAIHLNLASMIYERRQRSSDETILNKKEPYVSNWVERLRKIKAIRRRVVNL